MQLDKNLIGTMKAIFFVFLYVLAHFCKAQSLGPEQICRCYPPGHAPVCKPPAVERTEVAKCSKQVEIKITFVADDGAILWICGVNVRQTSQPGEMQSFTYNNMCDDFIIEIYNQVWSSGVAMLLEYDGKTYGTTDRSGNFQKPGVIPLYGIAKMNPTGDWTNNPSDYPFYTWTPAVVVQTLFGTHPNFDKLIGEGAYPINVDNGNLPQGTYGVKLQLPSFCS